MKNSGLLIVVSGPSGAGKGTIYNEVINRMPFIKKSISVTTRKPRPTEIDGVHYHFKTVEEYQQMIASGDFLETAEVYCNYYGTPKAPVFEMLNRGDDVMFEVDILGAKQIKKRYPTCVSIYIMTKDFEELEKRLRARNTETEDSIQRRLGSAKNELNEYKNFDYIVFNDKVEDAVSRVINIINAEKSRVRINENYILRLLENK